MKLTRSKLKQIIEEELGTPPRPGISELEAEINAVLERHALEYQVITSAEMGQVREAIAAALSAL